MLDESAGSFAALYPISRIVLSEYFRTLARKMYEIADISKMYFPWSWIIVKYHDMNRATLIEQIAEARTALEKLLTLLNLRPSRPIGLLLISIDPGGNRRACETAGKSGKQIERCVISSFQIAERMGFKGDFRRWEDLCGLAIVTFPLPAIRDATRPPISVNETLDGELVASDSQGLPFQLIQSNPSQDLPIYFYAFDLLRRKWQLASLSIEHGLDQPLPAITACCSHHGGLHSLNVRRHSDHSLNH